MTSDLHYDSPELAHLTGEERTRWLAEVTRIRLLMPHLPVPSIPSREALDEARDRAAERERRQLDEPAPHPDEGLCDDVRCPHCHMSPDVPGIADDLVPLPAPDPRVTAISETIYRAAWLMPLAKVILSGIQADRELSSAADVQSLAGMKRMEVALASHSRVEDMAQALRRSEPPHLGVGVVMYLLSLIERAEQVLRRIDDGVPGALHQAHWLYPHLRREAGALGGEKYISSEAPSLTDDERSGVVLSDLPDIPIEPAITLDEED